MHCHVAGKEKVRKNHSSQKHKSKNYRENSIPLLMSHFIHSFTQESQTKQAWQNQNHIQKLWISCGHLFATTYLLAFVVPVFLRIPLVRRSLSSLKIVSSETIGRTFLSSAIPPLPWSEINSISLI